MSQKTLIPIVTAPFLKYTPQDQPFNFVLRAARCRVRESKKDNKPKRFILEWFFLRGRMALPASKKKYERLRLLLVEAREEAGLTQVGLGKKLHRPQSFVSKIERGLRNVDLIEFIEIAKAIGFDPAEFLQKLEISK